MNPARLILSPELLAQVVTHARDARPKEAVGLLGGRSTGEVDLAVPLVNIASSERAFIVDPYSQYCALHYIEAEHLNLLAIYHSHPDGGVEPSAEDLAYARRWPCAHLVVAVRQSHVGEERLRAFCFDQRGGTETVGIEVICRR